MALNALSFILSETEAMRDAADISTEISQVEDKWVAGSLERCVADAGACERARLFPTHGCAILSRLDR